MKKMYAKPESSELCFGAQGSILTNSSVGYSDIESFIIEDDSDEWN